MLAHNVLRHAQDMNWGPLDATYPPFAAADSLFYDKPLRSTATAEDLFTPAAAVPWDSWSQGGDETWSTWTPQGATLPEQGWKIHVSATAATAETALRTVSLYCHRNALPFKFLRTDRVLRATLSKDGDRRVAGKFITIYPTAPGDLHAHLTQLDAVLAGLDGPYVLTDLRWNQGPVFVRYGAFTRQVVNDNGADVLAIRDLDTGALVPDVRTTAFHLPAWVQMPRFLEEQLEQLATTPPDGFPQIHGALHFSNAGGVYEASLNGRPVIVKEARPQVGWTPDGRDAVQRLNDEAALLEALQGTVAAPALLGTLEVHGHSFVAMERIDGTPLNTAMAARNPLSTAGCSPEERRAYREWAATIAASLRRAIGALHASGRVHGDLHPGNVIVRDDDSIVLLDFEMSTPIAQERSAMIGAPGFVAADGRSPADRDLYAVACIELFMFLPLTPLLALDATKATQLLNEAAAQFSLDQAWVDEHLTVLASRHRNPAELSLATGTAGFTTAGSTVEQLARTLLGDATPNREDRLWPGDPAQFSEPASSLAHGALGVFTVLSHSGLDPDPCHLDWVEALESRSTSPDRVGLFDGLAGAIWAYRRIGLHLAADRRLAQLRKLPRHRLGFDLYGGLPGVGLTLLAESNRHPELRDEVHDIATTIHQRWEGAEPPTRVSTGAGGLLRGATGSALFGLRLFEATGDRQHLRIATQAIDYDLNSLRAARDGSLHVDEGWRLLPYLGNGSAGIGIVLAQLVTHLPGDSRYLEALDGIARAANAPFAAQSGLFQGRAGLIQFLLTLERTRLATTATTAALHEHVAQLQLHALRRGGELRFAGDGLLRASCDLATGSAGILGTLIDFHAGTDHDNACLPFLTPTCDVENHLPRHAAASRQGGERYGVPLVPAVA